MCTDVLRLHCYSWLFSVLFANCTHCQRLFLEQQKCRGNICSDTWNTHTPFVRDLPRWANTRKVEPIGILLKQETVSGSGISWAICKSAPRSRQNTMPAATTQFFTGQMPFLLPNQRVKALKAGNIKEFNRQLSGWHAYKLTYNQTAAGYLESPVIRFCCGVNHCAYQWLKHLYSCGIFMI